MSEPSLPELEAERDRLFAQLSVVGDFRRGSVSENWRRCGKPNCACADPGHPGHGPRYPVDPVGGPPETRRPAARGGRGGEGARGRWRGTRSSGDRGADRRGERDDLRGQAAGRNGRAPRRRGRKRGLCDALAAEKSAEIGRLAADAARSLGCGDAGLEAAEAVIRAGMLRLGCGMLGELLAADRGYRGPRVACGNGHEAVFVSYRDKVHRHRARAGHREAGLVSLRQVPARPGAPRTPSSGVGGRVPVAGPGRDERHGRRRRGPFARAAGLLEDLAGVRLTVKRVERAAEASGAAAAAAGRGRARLIAARKLVPLPPSPPPDKLYAAIDGTGVPMTARETERAGREGRGRPGPHPRGQARRLLHPGQAGQGRLPGPGPGLHQRHRHLRARRGVRDLVKAEGIRRGADHVRQLTILGDGAAWIWGIATAKFPEATQVVDLFHAREHLHDLARRLEFMLLRPEEEWLAARLEDLDYGYIDGIVAATRQYPLEGVKKDEIDTALGYFENNAPRMRYHWFRQCGLFVGSGVVEASCKTVIGQRLKQSGMHWTVNGADAIIALRCREASRPWKTSLPTPRTLRHHRLTSPARKTILVTYKSDAHPLRRSVPMNDGGPWYNL